jgi:hypothetical protein
MASFIESDLPFYRFSRVLGHNLYFMAVDLILGAACVSRSAIASEIRSKLGILSYFEVSGVVVENANFSRVRILAGNTSTKYKRRKKVEVLVFPAKCHPHLKFHIYPHNTTRKIRL